MAYTALYRKYRPSNFANVVGQDVVVDILKNSIINNKISHAYLFTGPRGTGKTSIAKIFAHAVNCTDFNGDICGKCFNCVNLLTNDSDIIEIDAASNNGVDEIRALRDNSKLLPSFCKYKIYIIDEVHMLSIGAFNALLKTLEEPPSHVIFILATTEPNKIPLTILSRCQRFDFQKISIDQLISRLKYIVENENRVVSDDVLLKIAEVSDGGLRDAINLLDQALSLPDELITIEEIYKLSGYVSSEFIQSLFLSLTNFNYKDLLTYCNDISSNGLNYRSIVDSLLILIRDYSIYSKLSDYFDYEYTEFLKQISLNSNQISKITFYLNDLAKELKNSFNQGMLFEIYMIQIANLFDNNKKISNNKDLIEANEANIDTSQNEIVNDASMKELINNAKITSEPQKKSNSDDEVINNNLEEENTINNYLIRIRINNVFAEADKKILIDINNNYDKLYDFVSNKTYNILANLLLNGKVVVASSKYLLFAFNNSSDVINFNKKISQIEGFVKEIFDNSYKVIALTNDEWNKCKEDFIKNKKNNIKYVFVEENDVQLEQGEFYSDLENSALDIFGNDTVSVK